MIKGCVYARYSTDKQTGESVKVQVEKCQEFCEAQGILVCEVFIDKAKSGTTEGGRDQYLKMLDMASNGFFDAIITYKYDRIGRSFVETVRSIYELERYYGVNVYSATEPNDPLVRNILLSVAEDFSRQLAGRVFDSMSGNAAQGFHCGGRPPYGYKAIEISDPSGRTDTKGNPIKHMIFELDSEQAVIVKRIFQAYADGNSMKHIAHELNEEGVVSPGGGTWDISAVRYIIFNETYRGWRIWNKTKKIRKPDGKKTYRHRPKSEWVIVEDAHPAIINDELWDAVEETKKRKEKYQNKKIGNQITAFSSYLLTGLVKCSECSGNFVMHKARGSDPVKRYYYYRCSYHERRGNSVCSNSTTIHRERIEGAVLNLLQQEILTQDTIQMLVEDVRRAWNSQGDTTQDEVKKVERELKKVERELRNLVQAIKATGISETLKSELDKCEQRRANLEQSRHGLLKTKPKKTAFPTQKEITDILQGFRCVLESGTHQEKRRLLEENIESIEVKSSGEVLLKVNPAGLLPLPDFPSGWCRGSDSNRYDQLARGF